MLCQSLFLSQTPMRTVFPATSVSQCFQQIELKACIYDLFIVEGTLYSLVEICRNSKSEF